MEFWKMNGAGNDFIVIDDRQDAVPADKWPDLARTLCERHLSIGADGLMVVKRPTCGGDYRMLFFNSDGSMGEMCGNGARCICRFAHELGIAGEHMTVQTDAGLVPGWHLSGEQYRIRLNTPTVAELNRVEDVTYIELGNPGLPHAVREYRGDVWADADALRPQMQALRHHPAFPKGANVNYYTSISDTEVKVLTFERGVEDFTLACGTGCGSVAATLWLQGRLPGGALTLQNRGGTLKVRVEGENGRVTALYQEGPTQITEILEWEP